MSPALAQFRWSSSVSARGMKTGYVALEGAKEYGDDSIIVNVQEQAGRLEASPRPAVF